MRGAQVHNVHFIPIPFCVNLYLCQSYYVLAATLDEMVLQLPRSFNYLIEIHFLFECENCLQQINRNDFVMDTFLFLLLRERSPDQNLLLPWARTPQDTITNYREAISLRVPSCPNIIKRNRVLVSVQINIQD